MGKPYFVSSVWATESFCSGEFGDAEIKGMMINESMKR